MGDGGGFLGRIVQVLIGLVLLGVVLSALQQALARVLPGILVTGAIVAAVWLVISWVRRRSDQW